MLNLRDSSSKSNRAGTPSFCRGILPITRRVLDRFLRCRATSIYYYFLIRDGLTGKRRKTTYRMRAEDAPKDAEPDLASLEVRQVPEPGEMPSPGYQPPIVKR